MIQFNMFEAKTNLSKISKLLEEGKENCVILLRNGNPIIKMALIEDNPRKNLFGCAKGLFEIPENFDDIDVSNR